MYRCNHAKPCASAHAYTIFNVHRLREHLLCKYANSSIQLRINKVTTESLSKHFGTSSQQTYCQSVAQSLHRACMRMWCIREYAISTQGGIDFTLYVWAVLLPMLCNLKVQAHTNKHTKTVIESVSSQSLRTNLQKAHNCSAADYFKNILPGVHVACQI